MGCAASVTGGATSGQNLTPAHVALALNLVAHEQLKHHNKNSANGASDNSSGNNNDANSRPTRLDMPYALNANGNDSDNGSNTDISEAQRYAPIRSTCSCVSATSTNEESLSRLCSQSITSLQGSTDSVACQCNDLEDQHYLEKRTYSVSLESGTDETADASSPPEGKTITSIHVTEFAPRVFRTLRRINGVEDDLFADELMLPESDIVLKKGEGRSQALFLKSKNMLFLCKTISVDEVHVLLHILKAYTKYMMQHRNTLIMRFYMLLRVSVGKEIGFLLCFGDVYSCAHTINEKWDIKGRMPKPGKFMFFPQTLHPEACAYPYVVSTPTTSGNDSAESELVFSDAAVQAERRRHFRDRGSVAVAAEHSEMDYAGENIACTASQLTQADGNEGGGGAIAKSQGELSRDAKDHVTIPTRHDKDLTRMFWVKRSLRDDLLQQLDADFEFLHRVNLMDYSLLVGVSYGNSRASLSGRHHMQLYNMLPSGDCLTGDAVEVRPVTPFTASRHKRTERHTTTSRFAQGVRSLHDDEVYFIGIIDILTAYNIKKKSANLFKSFLWEQATLSTIPPGEYHARIKRYTHIIFPSVWCHDRNLSSQN